MKGLLPLAVLLFASPALTGSIEQRPGWAVHDTEQSYEALIDSVKRSAKERQMVVVTEAGPTESAARRGIEIPGNRVIGIFNNDFAVRAMQLSVPAMIEAPIRMYVTEDGDGTATLSYKKPSSVFGPYIDEGGEALEALAAELDEIFADIAKRAIGD